MNRRASFMAASVLACVLVAAPAVVPMGKRLVFNATSSAPVGFYWLGGAAPKVGDLALVRPPQNLAGWMARRGYLPLNVPLIKHVAAIDGQVVCVRAGAVWIDDQRVGAVLERDRVGRPLPAASLCRRLLLGEVFLFNTALRSLDSRYFGPLPRRCVVGRLTPLWTWER